MNSYVLDSSVVIKWFTPEVFSAQAVLLQAAGVPLHSPDFLDVEIAAIVWKKMIRDGMPGTDADFIIQQLSTLPITRHHTQSLVSEAFNLSHRTNRTVYDCLHLALAVQLQSVMITADDKLVNSLSGTTWAKHLLKLADYPPASTP